MKVDSLDQDELGQGCFSESDNRFPAIIAEILAMVKRKTKTKNNRSRKTKRSRNNSQRKSARKRKASKSQKSEYDDPLKLDLEDSLVTMVFWEEDSRFQPGQPDENEEGEEFHRRTFDVDGILELHKGILAALDFIVEYSDELVDDDQQLEEVHAQQEVYEQLAA